ncbi:fibronectin type III domain-containing protein [Lactococcus petauri]|uniref:Fibronectin type III domain-containing protein n=1 Tax=Lactococcus petauri TaxID=1940789 RepID=A0AAJ2IXR1_9LACT|nr:fibronectin type III domain-containing protein [Lactococcus petauri]MDT2526372.1 fibronectin type III domain-containing protein [Lactococcus petauri]MDT2540917.1 fibronectin type III domain-containing protein [Lactococcus petauri]MDT2557491.1 fibronectin type III domain-containing protein [Lactococcus petauri]MDT2559434.1 fibronectin type III domain-containing protein [Lactococcus petauri]MDT2568007.1 fibronectin type III domain-containing protein [Lactococcus petauri]
MADNNYLHTAYAKSADGTDGFTTVYPNLNLGNDTKTFTGAIGSWGSGSSSILTEPDTQKTQDGDFNYLTSKSTRNAIDWFRFFLGPDPARPNITKVLVKPNTKYTFSVLLKGTGQHTIYAYQNWTAPNTPWSFEINLTNDWKLYTFIVTSSNVIPDRNVQFFIRSNNGTEISLKKPKVEEGSVATPYMPSSSEVTTDDWPKYVGTYVDTNPVSSTDPSKYGWDEMNYRIYLDGIAVAGSKLLSAKVENLKPDTSYTIQVKQVSGEEESDFSDSVTFKTNVQK